MAFLEGQAAIRYPVEATATSPGNACFQDVLPVARADGVPRGADPVPAAAGGAPRAVRRAVGPRDRQPAGLRRSSPRSTSGWLVGARASCRSAPGSASRRRCSSRFGTVFWYSAQLGDDVVPGPRPGGRRCCCSRSGSRWARTGTRPTTRTSSPHPDGADVARSAGAGSPGSSAGRGSPGSASTGARSSPASCSGWPARARLTVVFGAPFFLLVGGGGSWRRRGLSAALGAAIPIGALLALQPRRRPASSSIPATSTCTELEAGFYPQPRLPPRLGDRGPPLPPPESLDHVVQHAGDPAGPSSRRRSATAGRCAPTRARSAACSTRDCPLALPRDTGMSILLDEPGLPPRAPGAPLGLRPSRLVTGAVLAVLVDRVRQPHALQPGLGPVRLSLQPRLRAVGAAPRRDRAWSGSRGGGVGLADAGVAGSASGVVPSVAINLWGVDLGRRPRDGDRRPGGASRRRHRRPDATGRLASLRRVGVGLLASALWLWRLMPGVGFWDTAEFQMVLPVMGTAHPTGYPTYVLLGWLASTCS